MNYWQYLNTIQALGDTRRLSPTGERVSLAQLCKIEERDGGSEICREFNQRCVAIKYSGKESSSMANKS